MLQAALWIAMACAVCGALARNRVAWVLLASVAYCLYLDWAGVPFSVTRWLMLDVSAMILIALFAKRTLANCIILALFFAGWAAYSLPDPYRYIGSVAITILQLLLTFPMANVWKRMKLVRGRKPDIWNVFDLRAVHAGEAGG